MSSQNNFKIGDLYASKIDNSVYKIVQIDVTVIILAKNNNTSLLRIEKHMFDKIMKPK